MLGIGLDNKDGHKRITKGDNFMLVGGSRGKSLDDVSPEELRDIVDECTH